ncbi:venom phosphodiesterase [Procambarus clarkii]|uniref:venom phosphodiesterase n=1 Tax=Procambarus clarkii TaxID=6728 RepID=UPI001E6759EA|nr:venom phosphodiesterase-like [Procambarus clarkii]
MIAKTLLLSAAVGVVWARLAHQTPTLPTHLSPESCPPTFHNNHPLILVSVDGFRADYILRGRTPTIEALGASGVRAPYIKPSYPTITFPNHYTMVTGLYPPAHGIVANKFYDPVFRSEFRRKRPDSYTRRWWGGEPVWKTAEKQGKRAATFFWPGSSVEGNRPSMWFRYNMSIPFSHRVDQVLAWLDLPPWERPAFMTLYMHEPDRSGHNFGPDSPQVDAALSHVDAMVKRLVEGLAARNLLSCVNLMVMADHGMATAGQQRVIRIDKYIPNVRNRTRFWNGVFGRMTPNDASPKTKEEMLRAVACKRPEMRVYEKSSLPVRWHVGQQRRVEDIVFDLDDGFQVAKDNKYIADAGDHGYDNYFSSMNAIFVAHGPEFRRNVEVEPFQNTELYNLMCVLLGVKPAPNNGTWGALHHLLANPPPPPYSTLQEVPPPVAEVRIDDTLDNNYSNPVCEGDLLEDEEFLEVLQEAQEEAPEVIAKHLPWGIPQLGKARDSTLLLLQPEFVSAYSTLVKMPLWTSFHLDQTNKGSKTYLPWRSDVRLRAKQRRSCQHYHSLAPLKISPQPLFSPKFSSREDCEQLPYLITNAVPFTNFLTQRWQELLKLVKQWSYRYRTLNVITGPVFDYDTDTFADDLRTIRPGGGEVVVPTHMFLVVSRCSVLVSHVSQCPHDHLDALAFVYPQSLAVSNCLSAERFAQEFSATVQDVEKITGLKFYPNLNFEDQVRLQVRIHSNIWGRESWLNRIRSDIVTISK